MQASPHKVEAGGLGDPKEGGMISPIGCSPFQNKPHCSFCQPWVPALQQAPSPSACASPQCTTGSVTFVGLYALCFHLCRLSGVVFLASRWLPWPCSPADCLSALCSPKIFLTAQKPVTRLQSTWICCSASWQPPEDLPCTCRAHGSAAQPASNIIQTLPCTCRARGSPAQPAGSPTEAGGCSAVCSTCSWRQGSQHGQPAPAGPGGACSCAAAAGGAAAAAAKAGQYSGVQGHACQGKVA